MSFELTKKIMRHKSLGITSTEKMVMVCLATYLGKEGHSYPSYATIAEECCVKIITARRAVKTLIDKGYVVKKRRYTQRGEPTSNLYYLHLPEQDHHDPTRDHKDPTYDHTVPEAGSPTILPRITGDPTYDHGGSYLGSPVILPRIVDDPRVNTEYITEEIKNKKIENTEEGETPELKTPLGVTAGRDFVFEKGSQEREEKERPRGRLDNLITEGPYAGMTVRQMVEAIRASATKEHEAREKAAAEREEKRKEERRAWAAEMERCQKEAEIAMAPLNRKHYLLKNN